MDELGTTSSEGAILEFTVKHLGTCPGTIKVNSNIEYEDNEGNIVVLVIQRLKWNVMSPFASKNAQNR